MGYKKRISLLAVCAILWAVTISSTIYGKDRFADTATRQMAIELSEFIQIPGANPILRPGPKGAWDDVVIEAADALEDLGTYYVYYHAISTLATGQFQYQLGVASATNPMGPFKKHGDKPIVPVGPKGSWDEGATACAMVLKESNKKYCIWYWAMDAVGNWGNEAVGLATAEHPLGPWKKYEGNPVMDDFGYIGGAIKHDGKYLLYSAYPLSTNGYKSDYGPLAVAIADKPEGPFVKYSGNPILEMGNPGDWDDGGISEAEVLFHNGMFHMFYGGTRIYGPRLEHIGYAYSFDGFKWFKYGKNPVASRHANPNFAAFAEVHAIIEMPYIYLYHTIRPESYEKRNYPWKIDGEDVGVQVLATQRPFRIDMPVFNRDKLAAGEITTLSDAPPICLSNITNLSLTAECKYSPNAKKPLRIHVRSSYDAINYDTTDLYTFDNVLQPGQLARKTFHLESKAKFITVLVENLDEKESVSDVKIIATVGG
ncbi:hypothetical protein ACFL1G_07475 [Planctomycetota bacterium]